MLSKKGTGKHVSRWRVEQIVHKEKTVIHGRDCIRCDIRRNIEPEAAASLAERKRKRQVRS